MRSITLAAALTVGAFAAASAEEAPGPLVDAEWLEARLGSSDLVVLDIRNAIDGGSAEAFAEGHIPGAVYSNYLEDDWRVEVEGVPGMTPEVEDLEALVGSLGIDNDDRVVVVHGGVDATDFGSAARVYWTFQYLGHDAVSILDGGWRGWTADADRPVATGAAEVEPATFVADVRDELLIETEEVEAGLDDPRVVRIDARPEAQYRGESKHDAAKAAGRIPKSVGLEYALWIDPETGRLRPREEIVEFVPEKVRNGEADLVVSYCNTGHWAATNWFVLSEYLGYDNVRLYDASMTGWTFDVTRPIETGKGIWAAVSRWVQS